MFSWEKIKKPIVALSPMADYTDSPFSRICKKYGADIIYREMVSSDALIHGSEKTLSMAGFEKEERPIILQIFGSDPSVMARAAEILEKKYKPDGIDINMGCPARKIVGSFNGASLMKDPRLAAQIVRAVKKAVKMPVSVKCRTGWAKKDEILKFAPIIGRAGAEALAIHGRTKAQGYKGKANWDVIAQVKKKSKIPILLNGDVTDYKTFKEALDISGADGVLIARGALGNPWVFENIKKKKDLQPTSAQIKKTILEHAKLHVAHYGKQGMITFRKHLVCYVKGLPGAKRMRKKLVQVETQKDLKEALKLLA